MHRSEAIAAREIPALFAAWLGVAPEPSGRRADGSDAGIDMELFVAGQRLLFQVKGRDDVPTLERATGAFRAHLSVAGGTPVLVVPHAGQKAREWLREHELSWLDLSGNADIRAPGIRIVVEGKPNRFATAGRPSTVFSPKAARVTRLMLVDPDRWWTQGELTEATRLSHGFVSKLVGRMLADNLLVRGDSSSSMRPRSPSLLLDAWAQQYRFGDHHISRYVLSARTGPATLHALGQGLDHAGVEWAASGLAAAWSMSGFADFRMTTAYVRRPLLDPEALGLHPVDRGENVWILVPRDEGVFDGGERVGDVPCVSPAQVYLDLAAHPERAKEAAERLRAERLNWRSM